MDEDFRKARRLVILLFIVCLCIALVCFGISGYLVVTLRGAEPINQRLVEISKITVMIGIFFLVLGFGYLLPLLLSRKNRKQGEVDSSEIFDETNMRRALEKYIPDGETLLAGIHSEEEETAVT